MPSDEFYRFIGKITIFNNDAHAVLCQVRLEEAGLRENLAEEIASMMRRNSVADCESAISLLSDATSDPELRRGLRSLAAQSAVMREARNGITHGFWEWSNPELEPMATSERIEMADTLATSETSVWESVAVGLEQVAIQGRRILHYMRSGEWI